MYGINFSKQTRHFRGLEKTQELVCKRSKCGQLFDHISELFYRVPPDTHKKDVIEI